MPAALEAIAHYRRKRGRETTGLARIYQEALALFAVTLHTGELPPLSACMHICT